MSQWLWNSSNDSRGDGDVERVGDQSSYVRDVSGQYTSKVGGATVSTVNSGMIFSNCALTRSALREAFQNHKFVLCSQPFQMSLPPPLFYHPPLSLFSLQVFPHRLRTRSQFSTRNDRIFQGIHYCMSVQVSCLFHCTTFYRNQ